MMKDDSGKFAVKKRINVIYTLQEEGFNGKDILSGAESNVLFNPRGEGLGKRWRGSVFFVISLSLLILFSSMVYAQANNAGQPITSPQTTVCCEKTKPGAWCQNTRQENCDSSFRATPTSCDATSFCTLGFCYDSQEGTCAEKTPQKVCEISGGVWTGGEINPPQCEMGCCVLGDQAALVSLVRCKRLSSFFGLQTDYRKNIKDENACIDIARSQDKGACVFESDFQKTCKLATRQECLGGNTTNKFHKDFLCTAEELGTICGPTTRTTCVDGKDEVYFVDTCGNPANVYDASRINDKAYWNKIVPKEKSCGFNAQGGNANAQGCGNCDYFLGSRCKKFESGKDTKRPSSGDFICRDLSCKKTYDGNSYRNGEAWCITDGKAGNGEDAVGSKYVRHMCVASEEIIEPCADFRQEVCIQDQIKTDKGVFQQAGCRANRWQECVFQDNKEDCENFDKRDCRWLEGLKIVNGTKQGSCVPDVPPGLTFWEEGEAKQICSQGSTRCVVEFEKGLFSSEKCVNNCECLEPSWIDEKMMGCNAVGDCGSKANYIGKETTGGFTTTTTKAKAKKK